ncbi:MAG: hypothetical protein HKN33_00375 [Pyrinomonadaceae bacterium]|nr:hypothetical protein [Pyrinomonadaceae bacterium]
MAVYLALLAVLILPSLGSAEAGIKKNQETKGILVTAVAHNERTREIARKLFPEDFAVKENGRPQKVISAQKVGLEPAVVAVILQDNLVMSVNNELPEIRKFIRSLPEGSRVMTGYLSSGSLRTRQDFTADLEKAAKSLRIIPGSSFMSPYSPFLQLRDAFKKFEGQPEMRRIALVVSDGLDFSARLRRLGSPFSAYVGTAVAEAQKRGISVYTIYAPAAGRRRSYRRAVNSGQSNLLKLADQTGGESFMTGSSFVTFDPYFKELKEIFENQWYIVYSSSNSGKGYRSVEVVTDFDIDLQHVDGYRVRD